ncbi:hypothetical protein ASZ90_000214 [hydrocarbon metagenome]|uniref:Uncharacterized protein n=1 Tax=hydrocarbon metagenome TaxID=938273 RepID=A0A0W8G9U8_9ZZZZ
MPRESKFDAVKLRALIADGKSAQQIMDAFGVKKPMLKSYLARLIQLDEKFYKIDGMEGRAVSGSPTFKKTGLHLGATLLKNYGFSEGDEFRVSCMEAGKIVLEKI